LSNKTTIAFAVGRRIALAVEPNAMIRSGNSGPAGDIPDTPGGNPDVRGDPPVAPPGLGLEHHVGNVVNFDMKTSGQLAGCRFAGGKAKSNGLPPA
jgi:hypothetical protein